ncbi:hypothetical protein [Pseudonocardia nigra]|uniref:hypothetical protein n=1 Tax=Pseudonocardia nigra TaxID=1921578 RepID=UPI001C5F519C|nr:hypothetical protein [Pseudonocardia nigra]
MYRPWSSTSDAPPPPLDRPVWVDLSAFYGEPDDPAAYPDDRPPGGLLKPSGRIPGVLRWWLRGVDGRWFGKVSFAVCDAYGAVVAEQRDVIVPAAALSPRVAEPRR